MTDEPMPASAAWHRPVAWDAYERLHRQDGTCDGLVWAAMHPDENGDCRVRQEAIREVLDALHVLTPIRVEGEWLPAPPPVAQVDRDVLLAGAHHPARAETSGDYEAHGPTIWATGEQSYAHLGYMAARSSDDLGDHLRETHGVRVLPGGDGSWCRWVEMHAARHDCRLIPAVPVDRTMAIINVHSALHGGRECDREARCPGLLDAIVAVGALAPLLTPGGEA